MNTYTRIGIVAFGAAVVFGPLYTVDKYSVVANLISELGAQYTQNNFIMIIAFFLLGAGIVIDGVRRFRVALVPFVLFGLAMAVVGMFPHKPLDASIPFNASFHNIHGILASVAGTVLTIGFIWRGFLIHGRQRFVCFYLAAVAVVFPVITLNLPIYQGIIQRIMYLQVLGWMWVNYPTQSLPQDG